MSGLASRCWLGLIALVCLSGVAAGQQRANFPIDIKTDIRFDIYFRLGPEIKRPTAPWYAYFPADPRMMPAPQMTPYPPWPQQFPPLPPDPKELKKLGAESLAATQRRTYYPTAYAPSREPIGYIPTQIPSYWRPNR